MVTKSQNVNIEDFTKEEIEEFCKSMLLPLNYFELPVQDRRDAFLKAHKERYASNDDPDNLTKEEK